MSSRKKIKRDRAVPFDMQEKTSPVLRFFSSQKFIAFAALVFLIILAFPLAKSYSRRVAGEREINAMREKIAQYEKDTSELHEIIDYLSSPEGAEEQGRASLNLKMPGEAVVVIDKTENLNETNKASESSDDCGNLRLWWNYFFE